MTRPDFYNGIHPQLDADVAARRREAYMVKLEVENAELTLALKQGSGVVMDGLITDASLRAQNADLRTALRTAAHIVKDEWPSDHRNGVLAAGWLTLTGDTVTCEYCGRVGSDDPGAYYHRKACEAQWCLKQLSTCTDPDEIRRLKAQLEAARYVGD